MSHRRWLYCLVAALACKVAVSQEVPKFSRHIATDSVRFVQLFSDDDRVGTLVFDNFIVATEAGPVTLPSVDVKKLTYVLKFESANEALITQHIRGFTSTPGSTSGAVVIHSGGKTTIVDMDKAVKAAKAQPRTKTANAAEVEKIARGQGFEPEKREENCDDFFTILENRVTPGKPLQVTILLLADRDAADDGSGALLAIDTIDVEISVSPSKKH